MIVGKLKRLATVPFRMGRRQALVLLILLAIFGARSRCAFH